MVVMDYTLVQIFYYSYQLYLLLFIHSFVCLSTHLPIYPFIFLFIYQILNESALVPSLLKLFSVRIGGPFNMLDFKDQLIALSKYLKPFKSQISKSKITLSDHNLVLISASYSPFQKIIFHSHCNFISHLPPPAEHEGLPSQESL